MIVAVRREVIAWILAGAALHWIIRNGFNKWTMTALGVSLGIGVSSRTRRKPKEPPQE